MSQHDGEIISIDCEIWAPEHPEATEWLWDDEDALESEAAPDQPPDRRSPLLFFCSMAVLGVVLAVVWRYAGAAQLADQVWANLKSSQASAALTAQAPSVPPPSQTAELDGLKAEIGKLTAANRQMAAEITTLQSQQRELARRAAAPTSTTHLFSDPAMLKLQIAPRALTTGRHLAVRPLSQRAARTHVAVPPPRPATHHLHWPRRTSAPDL